MKSDIYIYTNIIFQNFHLNYSYVMLTVVIIKKKLIFLKKKNNK